MKLTLAALALCASSLVAADYNYTGSYTNYWPVGATTPISTVYTATSCTDSVPNYYTSFTTAAVKTSTSIITPHYVSSTAVVYATSVQPTGSVTVATPSPGAAAENLLRQQGSLVGLGCALAAVVAML